MHSQIAHEATADDATADDATAAALRAAVRAPARGHTPAPAVPRRVLSVPSGHPYVQHLAVDAGDPTVVRLPDVPPADAAPGQWWPPVVFDPAWLRTHADEFDLVHLHFGLESFPLEHVDRVLATLRELRKPVVYTVHDLTNPQLTDQEPHRAQLAHLVAAADALITLTDGAAAEIEDRWGRRPVTIPHPNVFPLDEPAPIGSPSGAVVVGMHLRDLRPNIDAVGATETLLAAVAMLRAGGVDVVGRVHLNDRVRDPETRDRIVELITQAQEQEPARAQEPEPAQAQDHAVELVEGPRLSDDDLASSLADLDVAVLPYRHGTHSGWVELCHDLGVAVVGPRVGHAGEQHPGSFTAFDRGDPASLARALTDATSTAARPGSPARAALVAARRAERRVERVAIQAAHHDVYASAAAIA